MTAMDRIQGQAQAIEVLQAQLASGRVHHACIFHGPPGVGKFTTALAFGQILLCHQPARNLVGQVAACESCPSCTLFARQDASHPDLHIINKELARYSEDSATRQRKLTQIPVDVVRTALIEPVHRAATMRHGKLFIVDEAELLNPAGQNALLKTLEEPPPGTTMILVTTSEERLLPTIRSRCQRVAFVPLAAAAVRAWLDEHAPQLSDPQRQALVTFADGSLGRAALALAYGLVEWAQLLPSAMDRLAQGKTRGELGAELAERIDTLAKAWVDAHANASKEAANKLAADLMASLICAHARQRVAALAAQLPPGDEPTSEATLGPWLGVIDAVHEATAMLASNVNLSLVCDHLALTITRRLAAQG